ncbi:MAG TPA: hypothetical protein VJV23_01220, partial [Candidatus Polarisedimenticolia bacterium]|nr:hypothetical protein [Candidatus Polarisedimenticolia bacterium]
MPSRLRRRARLLVYAPAAALAVILVVAFFYVQTGHPDRLARARVIAALEAALGRPAEVGDVRLQYLPPGAVVEDVRAEGPLVAARRVEASLSLRALLRGRVVVKDLDVVEPVVRWDLDTERLLAVDRPRPEGPSRVTLRRLRVRGGTLLIGSERRDLEADLRGLALHADNAGGAKLEGPWLGSAHFREGRLAFGDFALAGVAGSIAFEGRPERVHASRLRLRAEGVDIGGRAEIFPGEPVRGRLDLSARIDPQAPALSRPLPEFSADGVTVEVEVSLPGEGVLVAGSLVADAPRFSPRGQGPDWTGRRGEMTLRSGHGRVEVAGTVESFLGGTLDFGYHGDDAMPRRHHVSLHFDRVDLAGTLAGLRLPGRPGAAPSGALSGQAAMSWPAGGVRRAEGEATLAIEERPGALPVSGVGRLTWHGLRFQVHAARLGTPGSTVDVSGVIDGSGSATRLGLELELDASDTLPLASLLESRFGLGRAPGGAGPAIAPTDLEGALAASITVEGTTDRPRVTAALSSDRLVVSLPAARTQAGVRRAALSLSRLNADVAYDSERLTLRLHRAAGDGLEASGDLAMAAGGPRRGAVEAARLEASGVPAGLLAALAG